MRQLTDLTIMRIAAKGEAFIKIGEKPADAIKRLMTARKRGMSTIKRSFPKDTALTSTYHYVHAYYYAMNNLLTITGSEGVDDLFEPLNTSPTTWPEGPEVEYDEDVADLV